MSTADQKAVRNDFDAQHPENTFRTNQEQLVSLLERQAVILAAGASLVVLGVVASGILSLNPLLSVIYVQHQPLAVLRAVGGTKQSVVGVAIIQALIIATIGYLLGAGVPPVFAMLLDQIVLTVARFERLVQVSVSAYLAGAGVASGFALLGGCAGAWRVTQIESANQLLINYSTLITFNLTLTWL